MYPLSWHPLFRLSIIRQFTLWLWLLLVFSGCSEENEGVLEYVVTGNAEVVGSNEVKVSAKVISNSENVTFGFRWWNVAIDGSEESVEFTEEVGTGTKEYTIMNLKRNETFGYQAFLKVGDNTRLAEPRMFVTEPGQAPVITSISTNSGIAGDTLTVFGEGFGTSVDDFTVTLDELIFEVVEVQPSAINAIVPYELSNIERTGNLNILFGSDIFSVPGTFSIAKAYTELARFSNRSCGFAVGNDLFLTDSNLRSLIKYSISENSIEDLMGNVPGVFGTHIWVADSKENMAYVMINPNQFISSRAFFSYNITNGAYTKLTDFPEGGNIFNLVLVEEAIYVFADDFEGCCRVGSALWKYDIAADSWKQTDLLVDPDVGLFGDQIVNFYTAGDSQIFFSAFDASSREYNLFSYNVQSTSLVLLTTLEIKPEYGFFLGDKLFIGGPRNYNYEFALGRLVRTVNNPLGNESEFFRPRIGFQYDDKLHLVHISRLYRLEQE